MRVSVSPRGEAAGVSPLPTAINDLFHTIGSSSGPKRSPIVRLLNRATDQPRGKPPSAGFFRISFEALEPNKQKALCRQPWMTNRFEVCDSLLLSLLDALGTLSPAHAHRSMTACPLPILKSRRAQSAMADKVLRPFA